VVFGAANELVITPNDEDAGFAPAVAGGPLDPGGLRFTQLKKLVASNRVWSEIRSWILKSRKIATSTDLKAGASSVFLPTVPFVPMGFRTKASVLNHSAAC
jgi:hypothetical protein